MEICKYCNSQNLHTQEKPPHIGLYCSDCGRFQKWVKQDGNKDTGEIASEAQEKYAISLLRKFKSKGVRMTMRQATSIIQAFKGD